MVVSTSVGEIGVNGGDGGERVDVAVPSDEGPQDHSTLSMVLLGRFRINGGDFLEDAAGEDATGHAGRCSDRLHVRRGGEVVGLRNVGTEHLFLGGRDQDLVVANTQRCDHIVVEELAYTVHAEDLGAIFGAYAYELFAGFETISWEKAERG
jgi:hypothetical protein